MVLKLEEVRSFFGVCIHLIQNIDLQDPIDEHILSKKNMVFKPALKPTPASMFSSKVILIMIKNF